MKQNPTNKIKIGDIFVNEWGYDQTNVNFFQVVRKTKKTIVVRSIESIKDYNSQSMTGKAIPNRNKFIGEEIRKIPYEYTKTDHCLKGIYVSFEYGCGHLWNGKPCNYSTYA